MTNEHKPLTKRESIDHLLEYMECETTDDALERIVMSDEHNPSICAKCGDIVEVEPDAQKMQCHVEGCGGASYPLTVLVGFPI